MSFNGPRPGFPLRPRPPKYPPKVAAQPTQVPQYASAVIAMVDDPASPKVATVYIANSLPAEDGYAIPSSLGVTFVQAPNAWNSSTAYSPGNYTQLNGTVYKCVAANTNSQPPNANWTTPSGVAFYNDPTLLDGGSNCTVDTYNKKIISIDQGVSNSPPSNPSDLFQLIQHNGAYNTTGDFQNPGPIDTTQLLTGALNVTPTVSSTGTLSLSAQSVSGTTDFTGTFTLNSVGTTATTWLKKIYLVASISGKNRWGIYGWVTPNSSGNYTGTWAGLGSGKQTYDLGVVYEGINHELSNVGTVWTNQFPNTILVSTPTGASVGFSGTPTIATWDAGKPGSSNSLFSPTAQVQFTLSESTNPDTSQWVYSVIGYVRQTGQTQWQSYPQAAGYGSGMTNGNLVSILYGPLTPGYNYDFAFLMADINGNLSNGGTPVVLLSNQFIANAQVPNTQLQAMPSSVSTNGPTISASSASARTIGKGIRQVVDFTFTETDWTSSYPTWLAGLYYVTRINGTTQTSHAMRISIASSTTGVYSGHAMCAAGDIIDIGIYYVDNTGKQSATVWPANLSGLTDPRGDFFDTGDPNGGILHARSAPGVRGVINEDGSAAQTADWLPESTSRKWAAESGANVTETRYAAGTGSGASQRTAATIAATTQATFSGAGITVDSGGYIHLTNQTQLIYPSQQSYLYAAYGNDGMFEFSVRFKRTVAQGSFALAFMTDAAAGASTFNNGYILTYESDPQLRFIAYQSGTANTLSSQACTALDTNWHTLKVTMEHPTAGSMVLHAYLDGVLYTSCTVTDSTYNYYTGTVGLSTFSTGGDVLIDPRCCNVVQDKLSYYRHHPSYTGNWDLSGNLTTSAGMTKNGAIVPVVSTSGITYTSSTGSPTTGSSQLEIFWDGTNGSIVPTYHPPASAVGSFTSVNAGNSGNALSNLNASTTYYFCFRINMSSNTLEYRQQSGGSNTDKTDESWLNLDGYTAFAKNLACSTPAVNTGSGGGTPPGGGGGGSSCPADDQVLETQRGFLPACQIIAGDFVRDLDGTWNEVYAAQSFPAQLAEVQIADEALRVDAAHEWMDPDGAWIGTMELRLGTLLQGNDGKLHPVQGLRFLGEGMMRKLVVHRKRFVIGRVVGHNATTL